MEENTKRIYRIIGSTTALKTDRAENDFYATPRIAVEKLLKMEDFSEHIIEPFAGNGDISKVLIEHGKKVFSNDIMERDYKLDSIDDVKNIVGFNGDCISNPPYDNATELVLHCLKMCKGHKCAFLLKLQFLETQKRYKQLFKDYPPTRIYVFVKRIACGKNGSFEHSTSAIAYAWFVWDNDGTKSEPIIRWI